MKTTMITHPVRVIVPAYKATSTIDVCLEHIVAACQSLADFEIVVVSHKTTIRTPIDRHVHVMHAEKALNAGEARNAGAQHCGESILVFVDADVLIGSEALIALLTPILSGTADATLGNYSTEMSSGQFFQNYKKLYINQAYDHEGFIQNEFWTAFSAITGRAFSNLGGFSAAFSNKGGEDTELGIRLSDAGYRIYAVSNAHGRHLKEFTFWSLIQNDLDKGTRTIRLALSNRMPLQANRHAGKTDQLAVGLACLLPLYTIIIVFQFWTVVFLPLWFALYAGSRGRFLIRCLHNGLPFTIGAVGMAWVLDIVRAISVFNGIIQYKLHRKSPAPEITFKPVALPSNEMRA